jgi:hypothetical protein
MFMKKWNICNDCRNINWNHLIIYYTAEEWAIQLKSVPLIYIYFNIEWFETSKTKTATNLTAIEWIQHSVINPDYHPNIEIV